MSRARSARRLAALVLLVLAAPAARAVDVHALLGAFANDQLVPAYRGFAADGAALAARAQALCAGRSDAAKLAATRTAWRDAYVRWRGLDAVQFGPALDLRVGRALDAWPVRPRLVDEGLARGPATLAFKDVGAQGKGLAALEYLLWDPERGEAELLAGLAGARCAYLLGAARELSHEAAALWARWDPQRGRFAREIAEAGHFGADPRHSYLTERAALGELVNRLVAGLEASAGRRLARPAGLGAHGDPSPERFEAARSGATRAGLLAHLDAVRTVLNGPGGDAGLVALLRDGGHAALAARLDAAGQAAQAAVAALPEPLAPAVVERRAAIEAAFNALLALRGLIETELAATVGVTMDFNENDGD